jgi:acyl-homoserine-lactone acylase
MAANGVCWAFFLRRGGMRNLLLVTILVGGALAAAAWAVMPHGPGDGELLALADQYDVRILRDNWGVPHIFGETDADTAFGLAYAHAEDDFPTIKETLLQTRGILASVDGPAAAPIDYLVGLLNVWEYVDEKYETDLAEDTRAMCEAYADGLNLYVAERPGLISRNLLPFTGKDVVAGFVFKGPFFYGLDREVMALFGDTRQSEVSEKQNPGVAVGKFIRRDPTVHIGSNTFAVAPSKTPDGSTYLNINSHQPWEGPVAWYEAHLKSEEGLDVTGGVFPGTPLVLHGHNRHLGWAHTVNGPDLVDIYVLDVNPNNPNQYRFDAEWKDFEVRQIPIKVKLWGPISWTVSQEALWSVHGPAVRRPHGTYAIRFAGMGDIRQVEQWYRMDQATTFEEWYAAMEMRAIPSLNCGYADKDQNIFYIYNALLPIRDERYDWSKYLPGDTSETLWTDHLPFADLPQVLNPPTGYIQNCNSSPFQTTVGEGNPREEDYSPTLGIETRMTNRALRANELLSADDEITWEEFKAYKFDTAFSEESECVKNWKRLCEAQTDDALGKEALQVLQQWDRRSNKENTSAALALLTLRPDPNGGARGDTPTDELLADLIDNARILKDKTGKIDPEWGEIYRIIRGDVNEPLDGAHDVLRAIYAVEKKDGEITGFEDGQLDGKGGDSFIQLVRWDADGNVSSEVIHQFGSATTRPESPHYNDQAPLFARMEMRMTLMDEEDIRANLEREYRPGKD